MKGERAHMMWMQSGPGGWWIHDFKKLWTAMFTVLAHAIAFQANGKCPGCGCEVAECDYCPWECPTV